MAEVGAIVGAHRRIAVVATPAVGSAAAFATVVVHAFANTLAGTEFVRASVVVTDGRRAILAAIAVRGAVAAPGTLLFQTTAFAGALNGAIIGTQRSGAVGTAPAHVALARAVHHVAGTVSAGSLRCAVVRARQDMAVFCSPARIARANASLTVAFSVATAVLGLGAVNAGAQLELAFHASEVAAAIALAIVAVTAAKAGPTLIALLALSRVQNVKLVVTLVASTGVFAATKHVHTAGTNIDSSDLASFSGDVLRFTLDLR